MEETIIQIILEIIIVLLGLYMAFFKSYFQEKGKNLATKEDIEDITTKVEGIKNEFLYTTQTKLSLKTEERIAVVSCYEKYNYWLNTILDSYFSGINESNISKLSDIENRINEARFQYIMADGKMELFVDNEELTKMTGELKIKTLELQHIVEACIGQVEFVIYEIESMKAITPLQQQMGELTKLLEKKRKLLEGFLNERSEKFVVIVPMHREFQILAYNHIQTLIEG